MMWARSFISHFKKIVVFTAVVILITESMNYLYVDDTDEFARYMLHEFYEEEQNIDRLYLGSSHVFSGIDPAILDGINGDYNFNLSTATQPLIASYYLLIEADKKHDIDRVYLDLYYYCTNGGAGRVHDYDALPYSWSVIHQMKPSLNKLAFMLDLSAPSYYYLTFFAFTRYKEQLFNLDYVAEVVQGKQTDVWKNYEYEHKAMISDKEYVIKSGNKGFRLYEGVIREGGLYGINADSPMKEDPMAPESLEYLLKIVEYCKEHNIALTWITCPITNFQLMRKGEYDNYVRQVTELAEEYDIPYYDFNLCKNEYLDLRDRKYWSDRDHLNLAGAEIFSDFLGKFLLREEAGENIRGEYFHTSYAEKIHASEEELYGIEVSQSEEYEHWLSDVSEEERDQYVIYKIRPIANLSEECVYIHVSNLGDGDLPAQEEIPLIRDGNDAYVILSKEEHGEMLIEAKLQDSLEVTNWCQIEY